MENYSVLVLLVEEHLYIVVSYYKTTEEQEMKEQERESNICQETVSSRKDSFNPTRTKWQRIAWEFRLYRGTMSSFYRTLCEAIMIADIDNTNRLSKAYPELVKELRK